MKTNFNFPKQICTIEFNSKNTYDVIEYLKANKIYTYTTKFGRPCMSDNIELGNNCIAGISLELAKELKSKLDIIIDDNSIEDLFTTEMLNNINVADKVNCELNCFTHTIIKATVISKDINTLQIKQYRSKKIYNIILGQACNFKMGW